jgi:hypothetical protein
MPIQPTVLSQAVTYALSRTATLIDLYGPRLAGSECCELAPLDICSKLEKICSSASLKPFQCERGGVRMSHPLWVPETNGLKGRNPKPATSIQWPALFAIVHWTYI